MIDKHQDDIYYANYHPDIGYTNLTTEPDAPELELTEYDKSEGWTIRTVKLIEVTK